MERSRTPSQILADVVASTNAHDLDGLVDCFAPGYVLTDPVHPARSFVGSAQVRKNWGTLFEAIPDVRLEVRQHTVTDTGFWVEAAQKGTRRDGTTMHSQMVFIAAVSEGRIASAHIYVAPVEPGGPGIDVVMAGMAGMAGMAHRSAPRPVAEAAGGRS